MAKWLTLRFAKPPFAGSTPAQDSDKSTCFYKYFLVHSGLSPPIAQLVEQLALNETVLGSSPSGRTRRRHASSLCRGGEMVDALVLGTSGAIRAGSSPVPGTKNKTEAVASVLFFYLSCNFIYVLSVTLSIVHFKLYVWNTLKGAFLF